MIKALEAKKKATQEVTEETKEQTKATEELITEEELQKEVLELLNMEREKANKLSKEQSQAAKDAAEAIEDLTKAEQESVDVFTEDNEQPTFLSKVLEEAQAVQSILQELAGDNEDIRRLLQISQLLNTISQASSSTDASASQAGSQLSNILTGAFYTGTKSSPEGLALVGERGAELYQTPSGKIGLFDKPQVSHLEGGTRIWNAHETNNILERMAAPNMGGNSNPTAIVNNIDIDYDKLSNAIADKFPSASIQDLGEHVALTMSHLKELETKIFKTRGKLYKG